MIYTVDEVSDLLDIPRPTLYRYLREYSIPHVRRSGKISIPEESFDRIKEARELHREGLGTDSVRRRLREGNEPIDAEELTERLDRLSEALERLQGEPGPANNAASHYREEALQAILEKQEILVSTVSDLTEKVETLLSTNGRSRTAPRGDLEQERSLPQRPERLYEAEDAHWTRSFARGSGEPVVASSATTGMMLDEPVVRVAADEDGDEAFDEDATTRIYPGPVEPFVAAERREKFGGLARRRRRIVLVMLFLALVAGAVLVWGLSGSTEEAEVEQAAAPVEQSGEEEDDSQSPPEVIEETPPAPPKAEVPNLAGMTLAEAEAGLTSAGLQLGAWNEIPDYDVPAGRVLLQGPEPGEEVDPETRVDLIISSGLPAYQPGPAGGYVGPEQYPGGVTPYPVGEVVSPPGPF